MRKVVGFVLFALVLTSLAPAQSSQASNSPRKVASRVAPNYPELAKKMHIQGIVKVEAVVRANGTVKSTRALGGNPVLIDAATDAVSKWKFEPASADTTEIVQLSFTPEQ
jgi:TonB family protein